MYNYCDSNTPATALTVRGRDIPTSEVVMPEQSSRLSLICGNCRQLFSIVPSRKALGETQYCSRQCWRDALSPIATLEKHTDRRSGADACWPWTGCRDDDGYGLIGAKYKQLRAHRVAWEQANGRTIPPGQVVRHGCPGGGNTWCCNPAHLTTGTVADNNADMVSQGRSLTGTLNPRTRLTEAQVTEIRTRHAAGEAIKALAREMGVGKTTLGHLVHGRTWKHVPMPTASRLFQEAR